MKKNLSPIVSLLLLIILLSSCNLHIEKRRYRPGYHIETTHYKKNNANSNKDLEKTAPPVHTSNPEWEIIKPKTSLQPQNTLPEKVKTSPQKIKNKTVSNLANQKKFNEPCDVIYFKDGTKVEARIDNISGTEIKYKKCNFLDGPTFTVSTNKIDRIVLKNNEVYLPEEDKSSLLKNDKPQTSIIASLVLGIIAAIFLIAGIVLVFVTGGGLFGGLLSAIGLAPAGLFSLIGLIISSTKLKNKDNISTASFILNIIVQVLAILFTILMFFI